MATAMATRFWKSDRLHVLRLRLETKTTSNLHTVDGTSRRHKMSVMNLRSTYRVPNHFGNCVNVALKRLENLSALGDNPGTVSRILQQNEFMARCFVRWVMKHVLKPF